MNKQLKHSLPLFKQLWSLAMAISYSLLLSALPYLLLNSYGVLIASIKLQLILVSQLYFQEISNISTLMAGKMEIILSDSSRLATGLSSGFSTTLEPIQAVLIVLLEALSMIKKSSSLNIQVKVRPQSMLELL
jgi:hypothetical protein